MFCCERKRNCFLQEIPSVYKAQKTSCRQKPDETLLTGTGINSFRSLKFKRCVELDVAARLRLNFCDYRFPSGKTRLSPDETTSRSISSGKNHDIPDGRTLRLAHQNHFGSQCATEACRMAPPCQGEAKKVSLWQATLNRVHSTPSALPK